jgi:N-acetylglutamate synthase-like GNAT family acetyltransferase
LQFTEDALELAHLFLRDDNRHSRQGQTAGAEDVLDPQSDPARLRAFFVHPGWARRGLGRDLLAASEAAIKAAGFQRVELVATLAGEPLYASCGYTVAERYDVPLAGGLSLPVVRMTRHLNRHRSGGSGDPTIRTG